MVYTNISKEKVKKTQWCKFLNKNTMYNERFHAITIEPLVRAYVRYTMYGFISNYLTYIISQIYVYYLYNKYMYFYLFCI
jgi:hypothetical protein